MSRAHAYSGPKLPKTLLDQVQSGRVGRSGHEQSRKQRRHAERAQKKQQSSRATVAVRRVHKSGPEAKRQPLPTLQSSTGHRPSREVKPSKSILKHTAQAEVHGPTTNSTEAASPTLDDSAEESATDADGDEQQTIPVTARSTRARFEEDDAEIARLEKKLGLRKGTGDVKDDELEWLVNGSDSGDEGHSASKRHRVDDDDNDAWLRAKRRKAKEVSLSATRDVSDDRSAEDSGFGDIFDAIDDDEIERTDQLYDNDSFEDFSSDEAPVPIPKKVRENPYIAPRITDAPSSKYLPPSLRKAPATDGETYVQLQRQLQGLLNRLSETNLASILHSVEQVYADSARQHVTSTLINLLTSRIADESTLNETFLILHAGFATAVYRVIGIDFIAQLVEALVKAYVDGEARAQQDDTNRGKEMLNVLAFLSNLYIFQAIGSELMFDFIRLLLAAFTEANTEVLLRIIRICGTQLRQDDPSSLKDIVLLLQRSITKVGGEAHVSVRTRFMIEIIMDLKNNRMKNGAGAAALAAEHVKGMKRTLGSLASSGRSMKNTEPLRIGLQDLRDADKKGKWWLIGASWRNPAKMAESENVQSQQSLDTAGSVLATNEAEDSDSKTDNVVDLSTLARAHGMNTDVRRAIFHALLDAVSYQHAHERLLKLNLKNKQSLEIPRVVLRCAAAEQTYNHFYTLVAQQFCKEHRLRKAWEFALLDVWRRMGEEATEDEDVSASEDNGSLSVREVYNLAKLYASLVAEGLLRLTILKALPFMSASGLQPKTKVFVRVLVATVLLLVRKKGRSTDIPFSEAVAEVFQHAHAAPHVAAGLRYFLTENFSRDDISGVLKEKKERVHVRKGLSHAIDALKESATNGRANAPSANDLHDVDNPDQDDDDDDDDDDMM